MMKTTNPIGAPSQQEKIWTMKDGKHIPIRLMGNKHLLNSIDMMERNGYISSSTHESYFSVIPPNGEMAQMAFEQEMDSAFQKLPSKTLQWLEEEREIRKI